MGLKFLNSELQMLCVMNCKKINKCIGNQQCNRHLNFPGQHYSFQGFFQTFRYVWSFSRLFKALKISTLNSWTLHTFPGSVRTLVIKCTVALIFQFSDNTTSVNTDVLGQSLEVRVNEVLPCVSDLHFAHLFLLSVHTTLCSSFLIFAVLFCWISIWNLQYAQQVHLLKRLKEYLLQLVLCYFLHVYTLSNK